MRYVIVAILLALAVFAAVAWSRDIVAAAWGAVAAIAVVTCAVAAWAWLAVWMHVLPLVATAIAQGAQAWAGAMRYRYQRERGRWYAHLAAQRLLDDDELPEGAALALELLDDAIRVMGPHAVTIPPWTTLNAHGGASREWSGRAWESAVNAIRDCLIVRQGGGGGTVVRPEYQSLDRLARMLRAGAIQIQEAE